MTDCILLLSLTNAQYRNLLEIIEQNYAETAKELLRFKASKHDIETNSYLCKFKNDNPEYLQSIDTKIKSLESLLEDTLTMKRGLVKSFEEYWDKKKIAG